MKLIKLALISAVFLFIVATLISLLIPSHIRISKAINVHAPKDSLLALVGNRERWPEWHPAFMRGDSAAPFAPITSTVLSRTDTSVVMELRQGGKRPVVSGWNVYGEPSADSVILQWYMDFHLKWYPWQKLGSLFFENTYGVMMEQGLGNIKKITGEK